MQGTATWLVESKQGMRDAANGLIERSAWFEVEPRPFDWYAVSVKAGGGHEEGFLSIKRTGTEVCPSTFY
jgi:hypothetical protein